MPVHQQVVGFSGLKTAQLWARDETLVDHGED